MNSERYDGARWSDDTIRRGAIRVGGDDLLLEHKSTIKIATVLPSAVRPCSSDAFGNHEDTALSKTPKPWHPEARLLFHILGELGFVKGVEFLWFMEREVLREPLEAAHQAQPCSLYQFGRCIRPVPCSDHDPISETSKNQ